MDAFSSPLLAATIILSVVSMFLGAAVVAALLIGALRRALRSAFGLTASVLLLVVVASSTGTYVASTLPGLQG